MGDSNNSGKTASRKPTKGKPRSEGTKPEDSASAEARESPSSWSLALEVLADHISLPLDRFDGWVVSTLERLARRTSTGRASLFQFSEDLVNVTNTHEWCADQSDSQIHLLQNIPSETFGYLRLPIIDHPWTGLKPRTDGVSTDHEAPSNSELAVRVESMQALLDWR